MKKSSLLIALWFQVFCLCPFAGAQSHEEDWIQVNLCAIYWGDNLERGVSGEWNTPELYVFSSGKYVQLNMLVNQIGPRFRYHGPRVMPIFRRVMGEEGEYVYRPIAQVALPASSISLLFLTQGDTGALSAAAIDISENAIPKGGIAFLNFTDKVIAADIKGVQQQVGPLQMSIFNPGKSELSEVPLKIAVFNENWEKAYATILRMVPDRSYLMVFYLQNGMEGAYRLRIFRSLQQLREGV